MGGAPPLRRASSLRALEQQVVGCRRCPRLVEWRERVAVEKRAAYVDEAYWGRPVPSFGDPNATVVLVGLAPAAHGANRTGRMFTGDRSGDWLYGALHETGFASQAESRHRGDGLALDGAFITATVRCAPPLNKPTTPERNACLDYLPIELELLPQAKVLVALGQIAWNGIFRAMAGTGVVVRPKPRFGHGAHATLGKYEVVASYHPSQQNTFTGRLTMPMLVEVLVRARRLAFGYDEP